MTEQSEIVRRALEFIELYFVKIRTVDEIAGALHVDLKHLQGVFKVETGKSLKEYIRTLRLKHLNRLLKRTKGREIAFFYAHAVGYGKLSSFYGFLKSQTGMTFIEYKNLCLKNTLMPPDNFESKNETNLETL